MTHIIQDWEKGRFLVPRRAFTDRGVFEKEYDAIFNRCWLYLGHASELAEPGSFLTRTVARRPVLFTRDRAGDYHALFNVCRPSCACITAGPLRRMGI
jgi:p-cumate 2,3-dioxygenase subunit alpha